MALLDPKSLTPPLNIKVIRDEAGLAVLIQWLKLHPTWCLDCETNPLKTFFQRKMRLLQFGDRDSQFVIDLLNFVNSPEELADAQGNFGVDLGKYPGLKFLFEQLRPFLESGDYLKVGTNLYFEYITLYWNFGIRPWKFFDCQLAERVISAGEHSLKDFEYFSMESMMERYFNVSIDKTLQTSFDIGSELSPEQYEYAALDVRFPLALRTRQIAIGHRDKLLRTMELENDAIGAFADMHAHGERLDINRWNKNTEEAQLKLSDALTRLDKSFLPLVGSKNVIITDADVDKAVKSWKVYNEVSPEEIILHAKKKECKKASPELVPQIETEMEKLAEARKVKKEEFKKAASELGKTRTKINNLAAKCEGEALINYDSESQVRKVLVEKFPKFRNLTSTNDDDLKKYEGDFIIDALRDYREWSKRVKTYGYSWTTEWITHPCSEEGWLSPYTKKLHYTINQLIAETGRTSADSPNCQNVPAVKEVRECFIADEGHTYIIVDMNGAELRIIADQSGAKSWIEAFERGEDVHSVSTEIIFPKEWEAEAEPDCAYYKLNNQGQPQRQKCKCKKHKERRDTTKALNFLLAYGGGPYTLAARTGMSIEAAKYVCAVHEKKFSDIWKYLGDSGVSSKANNESRDLFGRRRLLPAPTQERARKKCIDDYPESLEYPEYIKSRNIEAFIEKTGRKPKAEEKWELTHREPTQKEITKAFIAISHGIERAGRNHAIQGGNASIAKISLGSGFDKNGKGYLFHILPQYEAKLIKFVHDEIVVQCKIEVAEQVAAEIADAFKRAAAEKMSKVVMLADFKISKKWEK